MQQKQNLVAKVSLLGKKHDLPLLPSLILFFDKKYKTYEIVFKVGQTVFLERTQGKKRAGIAC
jgi:hypothetical protein